MFYYYPCAPSADYHTMTREMPYPFSYTGSHASGSTLPAMPSPPVPPAAAAAPAPMSAEESYVENILRMNRGKIATIYMTFENNSLWNAKVFRGRVETAGRDHIIISDPETGKRYLLLMVNLDYITFDEPIEYIPPTRPWREAETYEQNA